MLVHSEGEVLGVDIGGVIIDKANDGTDTSFFSENFLATTPVSEAFETLRDLVAQRFKQRVHLVSKCGGKVEEKTRRWMHHRSFHAFTGIASARMHFCRRREDKAGICRELGITHFIDDKLEVLSYLVDSVPHLYLFQGSPNEVRRYASVLPRVTPVDGWGAVRHNLLG